MYISAWEIYTENLRDIIAKAVRNGKVQLDDIVWCGPSGDAIIAATAADLGEEYAEYSDGGRCGEYLD